MKVIVKLFAAARELVGADEAELEVPDPATVADVRREMARQWPRLAPLAATSMIAVNAEYAADAQVVKPGVELALIPPVSGG